MVDNYRSINALAEFMNGAYKYEMVKDRLFESVRELESDTAGGSGCLLYTSDAADE